MHISDACIFLGASIPSQKWQPLVSNIPSDNRQQHVIGNKPLLE
jgi:hypothetical protein